MAEDRLRELERTFKESGSNQDELAYLQEQVRTGGTPDWEGYSRLAELNNEAAADYLRARIGRGDLTQEKLELAAYCSHEPARLVLGEAAPEVPGDLEEWVRGLTSLPRQQSIAIALTLCRAALPSYASYLAEHVPRLKELFGERGGHLREEDLFQDVRLPVERISTWLGCPCSDCAVALRALYRGCAGSVVGAGDGAGGPTVATALPLALAALIRFVNASVPDDDWLWAEGLGFASVEHAIERALTCGCLAVGSHTTSRSVVLAMVLEIAGEGTSP